MTPQETLARIPEIAESAEYEIRHEMQVIAESFGNGVSPVGAKRRLPVLKNIPALLALVVWQQEHLERAEGFLLEATNGTVHTDAITAFLAERPTT